jgi:hypothetical protein
MLIWMVNLALTSASAGECAQPSTLLEFQYAAIQGELAFAGMDIQGLVHARDEAAHHLECVQEPVTPDVAAAFHRLMAIVAFTEQDPERVLAEFHAARRLQPGYQIPEDVAPIGHPLIQLYEESLVAAEGQLLPVSPPVNGWVTVDGIRGAPVPSEISTILQAFESDQTLVETVWHRPGDELPIWGPDPAIVTAEGMGKMLSFGGTGASLVASGALLFAGWRNNCEFWYTDSGFVGKGAGHCGFFDGAFSDPISPEGTALEDQRSLTNGLLIGAGAAGVLAIGLGVVAVVKF